MVFYFASTDTTAALVTNPLPVQFSILQLNTTAIRLLLHCITCEDAAFRNLQIFSIKCAICETCHDWLQLLVCCQQFLKGDLTIS